LARGGDALLTLVFTAKVAASPQRVLRALTHSIALARWLPNHEGWIDGPPELVEEASHLRFRSRLNRIPVSAEARVLELRADLVRLRVRLGLFAFDARFAIRRGSAQAARIGLAVSLAGEVPVVSGSLDRIAARKLASQLAEQMLAALVAEAEAGQALLSPA
jgi:hypothetical protein